MLYKAGMFSQNAYGKSVASVISADSQFTFAACDDRHVAWTGAAIEDDRSLYPRNDEVCPFIGNSILNPPEPVKYDSPVPCINWGNTKS